MSVIAQTLYAAGESTEDDDLNEVTDGHNSEQNPDELRESPSNPVNETKYAQTHRNFDQTNTDNITNLGEQTPFGHRIDGSPWQAKNVLSAAALNQHRQESSSGDTNSLISWSKTATPWAEIQLTKLAMTK
ncbi:MAG: hypothetical protein Q9177_005114 [Variospora cf. flavescens]